MNLFQKNPFANNTQTRIVGKNINIDEKQKIENIKKTMLNLKFQKNEPKIDNQNQTISQPSTKEKIDILRNINR